MIRTKYIILWNIQSLRSLACKCNENLKKFQQKKLINQFKWTNYFYYSQKTIRFILLKRKFKILRYFELAEDVISSDPIFKKVTSLIQSGPFKLQNNNQNNDRIISVLQIKPNLK